MLTTMESALNSQWLFSVLIGLTAIERLFEMRISKRHAQWSFARGGIEFGQNHYPFMVVLHSGFLLACLAEVWLLDRVFIPAIGYPLLALAIAAQGLRWWCITTLGKRWNTRVIIVPGLPRITNGPYRFFSHPGFSHPAFSHPNYVAVVAEGIVLPLIHQAWLTALVFTVLNAALLRVRIRVENDALEQMTATDRSVT